MICPACKEEIVIRIGGREGTRYDTLSVYEAHHDTQKLDIVITCDGCATKFNTFVDINDCIVI